MDRRLPRFIATAKKLGYREIEVETNGTILSAPGLSAQLMGAGLTRAWVAVMHPDDDSNDRITQDPGGAVRTWAALREAGAEGLPLGILIAVTPANKDALPDLVGRLVREAPSVDSLRFSAVAWQEEEGTGYEALEKGLGRACIAARKARLDFRFESAFAPSPCLFSARFVSLHTPLWASYYATEYSVDGARIRLEACEDCGLVERCPGLHAEVVENRPDLIPSARLSDEAMVAFRGQLGGVGRHRHAQISRVTLQEDFFGRSDKINIRVNWACNQRCRFCWVDFDWTPPTRETVFDQLRENRELGHKWVVFTGGEPTLVPWLPEAVLEARQSGFSWVQIQSNGVHLADEKLRSSLVESGLTHALISLHGASAAVSDGITQAPGTFVRSVAGIDGLVADGVDVSLSHVLTRKNIGETLDFAHFVSERWKGAVQIVWSVAAPITSATQRYEDGLLGMDEVGPALKKGLEMCLELGVGFGGQNDTCGVPACVLDDDPRFVQPIGEAVLNEATDFVQPPLCEPCEKKSVCRGVRKEYFTRYGTQGLKPIS